MAQRAHSEIAIYSPAGYLLDRGPREGQHLIPGGKYLIPRLKGTDLQNPGGTWTRSEGQKESAPVLSLITSFFFIFWVIINF
jgi:hypothetical protein